MILSSISKLVKPEGIPLFVQLFLFGAGHNLELLHSL